MWERVDEIRWSQLYSAAIGDQLTEIEFPVLPPGEDDVGVESNRQYLN